MGYNLLLNGIYWGYNPFTNHLLTSWDIQVRFLLLVGLRPVSQAACDMCVVDLDHHCPWEASGLAGFLGMTTLSLTTGTSFGIQRGKETLCQSGRLRTFGRKVGCCDGTIR